MNGLISKNITSTMNKEVKMRRTYTDKRLYDKEWIYQKYWTEKLSLREIAMIFEHSDCDSVAEKIRLQMIKCGIKRRSPSETHILQHIKQGHVSGKDRIRHEILKRKYKINKLGREIIVLQEKL